MPQLVDVDGKTVPVRSRKLRDPHVDNVWVLMTTKGKLFDIDMPLFELQQTADGWEYLVSKARLIKHLRTVTPPFRIE